MMAKNLLLDAFEHAISMTMTIMLSALSDMVLEGDRVLVASGDGVGFAGCECPVNFS